MNATESNSTTTTTLKELLAHWQGHRRLTRKTIEAFPEDKLFTHSIGGMRSFGEITIELLKMGAPGAAGISTGKWISFDDFNMGGMSSKPTTKKEVLQIWDWSTEKINEYWKQVTAERLRETDIAYGVYEGTVLSHLQYFVDNEIHHRGQGYVYLRSLGIEPPFFWER